MNQCARPSREILTGIIVCISLISGITREKPKRKTANPLITNGKAVFVGGDGGKRTFEISIFG
jgi:hypothetical protein